jgi:hypothetical protein
VRITVEPLREPEPQQAQPQQAQAQQDWLHEDVLRAIWRIESKTPSIYVPPAVHSLGEPHDPVRKPSELDKRLRYEPLRLTPRELARLVMRARRAALRPSLPQKS